MAFIWRGLAYAARIPRGRCPLKSAPLSHLEGARAPWGAASLHGRDRIVVAGSPGWHAQPERTAAPDPRAPNEERALFDALIERSGLDPAGFDFTVHPIRQSAELGSHMELMVTVTCRAVRISRTYLSRAQGAAWLAELADDLRAGVYGK